MKNEAEKVSASYLAESTSKKASGTLQPQDKAAALSSDNGCPCDAASCDIVSCDAEEDILPDEEMLYDLADLFKVFADTTRIKILYCLMGRQLCVADIALAVNATQSAVSHQLRILKQAHLVKFRRDGKNVIYELSDNHVYTMLSQGMTHLCE